MPNSGNREDHEHRPHDEDEVYGITTAETSRTQEITRRQKQYIVTMLVRAVAVVVVVSVPGISWPIKIGLCLAAMIIPYVAVVRANGGPVQEKGPTNLLLAPPRDELGSAQRGLPGSGERSGFIEGDFFVKDERSPGPGTGAGSHEDGASQASTANGYIRRAPLSDGAPAQDRPADQNPDRPSPAHDGPAA
ncbi:MAG TPA: DUF3099 domain-containing protein [Actinocrinis sp.]|nr:DUF3099 domain-containing protein [Actinocrinis sp.]